MPIYKSKVKNKTFYRAIVNYTDSQGKYRKKTSKLFNTADEAKRAEMVLLNETKFTDKYSLTFDQCYEEYLADQKKKVKEQTWRKYDELYAHIKPVLGNKNIAKLNVSQYKVFLSSLNESLSVGRKNRIHIFVKTLIKYSNRMYGINSDVPDRVGGFVSHEKKKEMSFFTEEEFSLFISNADLLWGTLFKVLYYQGTRIGEANALTWRDVDFVKKTIHISKTVNTKIKGVKFILSTPKTKGSDRVIPISGKVLDDLRELKMWYSSMDHFNDDWFCFGGIRPLPDTTITKKKDDLIKLAGLKYIRIHDFRHSCASYYIHKGAQPILLSKLLGHSKVSITLDTYSHLYPDELEKIMD